MGRSYPAAMATGGIILAAIMLLLFPIAIMLGGAIWSALMGWLLVDDADSRAKVVHATRATERARPAPAAAKLSGAQPSCSPASERPRAGYPALAERERIM